MGGEGAFFLYQLNVHTFNCRHRADRRVKTKGFIKTKSLNGWLRRDGFKVVITF